MKLFNFLTQLKRRILPPKKNINTAHQNQQFFVGSNSDEIVQSIHNIRVQFAVCVEICNSFTRQRDTDTITRIHPMLSVNLNSTLQRKLYGDFFAQTKRTLVEIGNFPRAMGGPAFGTDFKSFETWAKHETTIGYNFPNNLDKFQPFVDLICAISEALSRPEATLAANVLHPDALLLARVAKSDYGWDNPACVAMMLSSATYAVTHLRSLIDVMIPYEAPIGRRERA